MIVFRIEHNESGDGPYFHGFKDKYGRDLMGDFMFNLKLHPRPIDEGIDFKKGIHYSGFKDIKSLRKWFSPILKQIMDDGNYSIVVYKVPLENVLIGKKQIAFERNGEYIPEMVARIRTLEELENYEKVFS